MQNKKIYQIANFKKTFREDVLKIYNHFNLKEFYNDNLYNEEFFRTLNTNTNIIYLNKFPLETFISVNFPFIKEISNKFSSQIQIKSAWIKIKDLQLESFNFSFGIHRDTAFKKSLNFVFNRDLFLINILYDENLYLLENLITDGLNRNIENFESIDKEAENIKKFFFDLKSNNLNDIFKN